MDISDATTMKALKMVEKEYGLQPKARGRLKKATAKKPAVKKAAMKTTTRTTKGRS